MIPAYDHTAFEMSILGSWCIPTFAGTTCIRYLNCSNWSSVIKICIYIDTIPILFIVTTAPPTWDWNCLESEFQCHNGQCITYHCVCDGKSNCYDGTDEDYCNSTGWFCYSPFQQECAYTRSRVSAVTFCSSHAFTSSLIYYSTEAQKMKSLEVE